MDVTTELYRLDCKEKGAKCALYVSIYALCKSTKSKDGIIRVECLSILIMVEVIFLGLMEDTMQVLAVEDHKGSREALEIILSSLSFFQRVDIVSKGLPAMELAQRRKYDVLIVDIELPDISGMKLIKSLRSIPQYRFTPIIVTSAHSSLMLRAFKELKCYEFLEKPYSHNELVQTIEDVKNSPLCSEDTEEAISFEGGGMTVRLNPKELLFVEAVQRSCVFHTRNQIHEIPYMQLKDVEQNLADRGFVRSHRSYLVNYRLVRAVRPVSRILWEIQFDHARSNALLSKTYKKVFDLHTSEKGADQGNARKNISQSKIC